MQKKRMAAQKRQIDANRALDLPEMIRRDVPHIEMQGNREVIIEGAKGVLEYTSDQIKLNAGSCVIRFSGSSLTIRAYSETQTEISGDILQIDFEN